MQLPKDIQSAIERLEAAGFEAFVVGGCVRDSLLGLKPHDWDIATSALPNQVKELFSELPFYEAGIAYGTVTLLFDGQAVEITTFRSEGAYLDNRHPSQVNFGTSLKEDLARRDFTMNALAYSPQKGLVDVFGGADDLAAGILRAVGKADERLLEDALRIMRALRFAANLGLEFEPGLRLALHENRALLGHVSVERINSELMRLLAGEQVLSVLLEFPDVLAVFIPEIAPTIGFEQCTQYHKYDVWTHTAYAVAGAVPDPLVRLILLFHDLGKPSTFFTDEEGRGHFYGHDKVGEGIARERLLALRFDRRTIDTVAGLIAHHQDKLRAENVRRLLCRLGEKNLRLLIEVKRGDIVSHADDFVSDRLDKLTEAEAELKRLLVEEACFALRDLAVDGTDLQALGYPQGRLLGDTLDALLDGVVDETLPNERAALLQAAAGLLRTATGAGAADAAGVADAVGFTDAAKFASKERVR